MDVLTTVPPVVLSWLPDQHTQRTKSVTEFIPFYFSYLNKNKVLCSGEKPSFFPENKIPNQKDWHSQERKAKWKNPVFEGQKYLDYLESEKSFKYQDVAEKFQVSEARVSQMVALAKRLPQEIKDYFYQEDGSGSIKGLTERKLRPLTLLSSDEKKLERFREIIGKMVS